MYPTDDLLGAHDTLGVMQAWVTQNVTFLRYGSDMGMGDSPCTLLVFPWQMARGGCGSITGNGVGLCTVATSSWSHSNSHSVLRWCSVGVPSQ